MDENKKLNILKDRKLDRQEKNKSEGLKKGKGATLCSFSFFNLKSNTMKKNHMTNVQLTLIFSKYLVQFRFSFSIISQIQPFSHTTLQLD